MLSVVWSSWQMWWAWSRLLLLWFLSLFVLHRTCLPGPVVPRKTIFLSTNFQVLMAGAQYIFEFLPLWAQWISIEHMLCTLIYIRHSWYIMDKAEAAPTLMLYAFTSTRTAPVPGAIHLLIAALGYTLFSFQGLLWHRYYYPCFTERQLWLRWMWAPG